MRTAILRLCCRARLSAPVAACLLASGCLSMSFQAGLKPGQAPAADGQTRYCIVSVHYEDRSEERSDGLSRSSMIPFSSASKEVWLKENTMGGSFPFPANMVWEDAALRRDLAALAVSRYPQLFAPDDVPAIPVAVNIMGQGRVPSWPIALELCTLAILGGIFPLPMEDPGDFTVTVAPFADGHTAGPRLPDCEFRNRAAGWITIFTPFGLIPYPGESDAPQATTVLDLDPKRMNEKMMRGPLQLAYDTCLEAVVLSLVQNRAALNQVAYTPIPGSRIVPARFDARAPVAAPAIAPATPAPPVAPIAPLPTDVPTY